MSDLVPASDIERIVGADRHPTDHLGRAVSAEQTVYVLHSQACLDSGVDLRDCAYSVALDRGIDTRVWVQDRPVRLAIFDGELMPDISAMLLGSDADPSPAHIEAVARTVCWMGGTEGHEPCMLHGDDSWTADTGYCEDGHDAAQQVLTSTDPAVLDALTDALVRAGRLRVFAVEGDSSTPTPDLRPKGDS